MATQKGRNWSSGDIVTAANLQSIERGVSAVAEEYTPTTWANGNTVTTAALNKIEQGIANAGGSSDFSMAEVTLINNTTDKYDVVIELPCIVFEELSTSAGFGDPDNELVIKALSYKNAPTYATIDVGSGAAATTIGDIRIISSAGGGYTFEITGDGAITISDSFSVE